MGYMRHRDAIENGKAMTNLRTYIDLIDEPIDNRVIPSTIGYIRYMADVPSDDYWKT